MNQINLKLEDQPQSQTSIRFRSNIKASKKILNSGEHLNPNHGVNHMSESPFDKKFIIVDDDSSESSSDSDDSDF